MNKWGMVILFVVAPTLLSNKCNQIQSQDNEFKETGYHNFQKFCEFSLSHPILHVSYVCMRRRKRLGCQNKLITGTLKNIIIKNKSWLSVLFNNLLSVVYTIQIRFISSFFSFYLLLILIAEEQLSYKHQFRSSKCNFKK